MHKLFNTCQPDQEFMHLNFQMNLSGRGGLEVEQWIDNSLLSISADQIHLSDSINCSVV